MGESNIYYVYVHTRNDTGEVFYVGKGKGNRAYSRHSRSDWWKSIVQKSGFSSEIVQSEMSQTDAYLLEMWLIAKLRHEGKILCNISMGGEGNSGAIPSLRKRVNCSNGMSFQSINDAAAWARISASKISAVVSGRRKTAAGLSWWLDGQPELAFECPKERMRRNSKPVWRSDGAKFPSILSAAREMNGNSSNIHKCIIGEIESAYGYGWSREKVPETPISRYDRASISLGIPVRCVETGEIFPSSEHAARNIRSTVRRSATGWPISCAAKGRQKSAYGYQWEYIK